MEARAQTYYVSGVIIFITTYVVVNLWFPAAAVLTVLAGFLYGTVLGVIYVDSAATIGALVAFGTSRNVAAKWIQHNWKRSLEGFNRSIDKYGRENLLLIRMIPLIPYFLLNILAGLTKVRTFTFAWTTALGSLPSILVFCYAGRQLLTIDSIDDILTVNTILAFILLTGFVGSALMIKWRLNQS